MSASQPASHGPIGAWARWLVIRGDALTLATVVAFSGAVLIGLSFTDLASQVWAGPGFALVMFGWVGVRWSRRIWRALLASVAARFASHDVGPSPVPWLSHAIWAAVNRFDPALDGPMVLLAEVDRSLTVFPNDAKGAFVRPTLRVVTNEEREATPVVSVDPSLPVPEPGSSDMMLAALMATPGRQITPEPLWPVCCGRLTTLVSLRPESRPTSARWLPARAVGEADADAAEQRGLHGYRCRTCGRAYATDPVW